MLARRPSDGNATCPGDIACLKREEIGGIICCSASRHSSRFLLGRVGLLPLPWLLLWFTRLLAPSLLTPFTPNLRSILVILLLFPVLLLLLLLLLLKLLILPPPLLGGAVRPLLLYVAHEGRAAALAIEEVVDLLGEDPARVLAVLGAGAGGLGLDDDAGWEVL